MLIEKFINSEQRVPVGGGGNKKCFLFENHVLLQGVFKEDDIKQEIQIGRALCDRGVAVIPTLEYQIIEPHQYGLSKGYILQPRARGEWLYGRRMTNTEYRKRLSDIAKMPQIKLNKFISDWLAIRQAGLGIDPSKCENFFYSNGDISFIDLNLRHRPVDLKTTFIEITAVLTGLGLKYTDGGTNVDDCIKIVKNTANAFVARGLSPQTISDVIHSQYGALFSGPQIDNIVAEINQTAGTRSQQMLNNILDR